MPLEKPLDHDPESPLPHTGRFHDGFGNKLTMAAYANPTDGNNQATGYGLVRFKKSTREITLECWPRFVDVTKPEAKQYAGWPLTVDAGGQLRPQAARVAAGAEGRRQEDPVVQVIDEASGEVVYTLRIKGTDVPAEGVPGGDVHGPRRRGGAAEDVEGSEVGAGGGGTRLDVVFDALRPRGVISRSRCRPPTCVECGSAVNCTIPGGAMRRSVGPRPV